LKHFIQNFGQTAEDEDMVTTDNLYKVASALFDGTNADPFDSPFSHNTTRLAYNSAL